MHIKTKLSCLTLSILLSACGGSSNNPTSANGITAATAAADLNVSPAVEAAVDNTINTENSAAVQNSVATPATSAPPDVTTVTPAEAVAEAEMQVDEPAGEPALSALNFPIEVTRKS